MKSQKKLPEKVEQHMMEFLSLMEEKMKHKTNDKVSSYGLSKKLPFSSQHKKKVKGFGFTGFKVRKVAPSANGHYLHSGEVTDRPTKHRNELSPISQELSLNTLNALDWMLQNMTDTSTQNDRESMTTLSSIEFGVDKNSVIDQLISTVEPAEIVVPVIRTTIRPTSGKSPKMKTKKSRRKGMSKTRKNQSKSSNVHLHFGEFKPKRVVDTMKMFPKFRRRVTEASQARSFGVQTLIDDGDKVDWSKPLIEETTDEQNPVIDLNKENDVKSAQLLEEIVALESLMTGLEKKVEKAHDEILREKIRRTPGIESSSQKSEYNVDNHGQVESSSVSTERNIPKSFPIVKDQQSALNLSLLHSESGFLPMVSKSREDFHQQPIHLITDIDTIIGVSRWSDWSEWGDCFCNKQLRTRRCIYSSSMSQGCKGKSNESRSCSGGWCPTSLPSVKVQPVERNRSLQSTAPEEIRDPHRRFRPFMLRTAISLP